MREIRARNVNEALFYGANMLLHEGDRQQSRAGQVTVAPWPVVTVTDRPRERVLFSPERDANPFFHLFEALWMLAGRNDVKWLDQFVHDYSERFGEPDGTQHDAYGHRWRVHFGFDQLEEVVRRLRRDPNDRQCVIQMWDASRKSSRLDGFSELTGEPRYREFGANDLLNPDWRTRPCNTHVYLRVLQRDDGLQYLDLTVLCRSNDAVWGAHGANAVHFSMLQEYLAGRIGVQVGRMYQWSNNYHVYTSVQSRLPSLPDDRYSSGVAEDLPIGTDWDHWDEDLQHFMETPFAGPYHNEWFSRVAAPMLWAHYCWRDCDDEGALKMIEQVAASDWQQAAWEWVQRRAERRTKK